jgi:hypothetical protein
VFVRSNSKSVTQKGSGSFLKQGNKLIGFPRSFLSCLREKYLKPLEDEGGISDGVLRLGGDDTGVEVETVGWEKYL